MHNLAKHPPPSSIKGNSFKVANCIVREKELSVHEIQVSIKDRLPLSMQDELQDKQEEQRYLTHKYWCVLLSTSKVKYNRIILVTQIKKIKTSISASHSDSDESISVPRKKKSRTGVRFKQQGKKRRPCITVYSTIAYFSRSQEFLSESKCRIVLNIVLEKRSNQKSIKDGLV